MLPFENVFFGWMIRFSAPAYDIVNLALKSLPDNRVREIRADVFSRLGVAHSSRIAFRVKRVTRELLKAAHVSPSIFGAEGFIDV